MHRKRIFALFLGVNRRGICRNMRGPHQWRFRCMFDQRGVHRLWRWSCTDVTRGFPHRSHFEIILCPFHRPLCSRMGLCCISLCFRLSLFMGYRTNCWEVWVDDSFMVMFWQVLCIRALMLSWTRFSAPKGMQERSQPKETCMATLLQ